MSEALRKAASRALGFLTEIDKDDNDRDFLHASQCYDIDRTMESLRAALVEPEQSEPVAHCRVRPFQGDESTPKVFVQWVKQPVPGPLFAAPVRREPLNITPPNAEGSTMCLIRWMAETPHGWVGSWDRAALEQFDLQRRVPLSDELFKDAMRYRFMRDTFQTMNLADNLDDKQVDAAIDEAMK